MMVLHDSVSQMMRQDQKMIQKCSHMKETILHKTWQGMNLERFLEEYNMCLCACKGQFDQH